MCTHFELQSFSVNLRTYTDSLLWLFVQVLEGEMLKSWTDRARNVKQNGWFWEYTLLGLTIQSVTVSDDGKRATVEAALQEAATLVDRNYPERNDSYRSTYSTRYDLRHGLDGWRMHGGAVLRT